MNEVKTIKDGIVKALEQIFIFIDLGESENVDLSNYIEDSLQFISFVVSLENIFSIEFPPELLLFENFRYTDDICTIISELLNNTT